MSSKSIYGVTKGTPFEEAVVNLAHGEAKGVMMYYALARLATEQGLPEVASKFIEAANQEANHAGFYAVLAGMFPQDFWDLVRGLQKAEASGVGTLRKFAGVFREQGLDDAAKQIDEFADQEGGHAVLLKEILDAQNQNVDTTGKEVFVCGVCGFEYVGDLSSEPDDFVCPVCGQPKSVFKAQ